VFFEEGAAERGRRKGRWGIDALFSNGRATKSKEGEARGVR